MIRRLNERALKRLSALEPAANALKIKFITEPDVSRVVDFGVNERGGLEAGLELARICLADLADVQLLPCPPGTFGMDSEVGLPLVQVTTDHPLAACLGSQFGGWQIKTADFFAIGSGPMRAARGAEKILEQYRLREREKDVVGVLECSGLPEADAIQHIASQCEVRPYNVTLCVAPTRSIAGGVQVVARSVEATLHKLFELEADLEKIVCAHGTAPLPPVAADDLTALGRTNDAILYGGRVTLWTDWTDAMIEELGPKIPSNSSKDHGAPFEEIFKAGGSDFYELDPLLFSAAQVNIVSTQSGNTFSFGKTRGDILHHSFFSAVSSKT